ncbi:MAG: sugar phosphate nucleotidyltransferase [Thermoanaerobaculia bacterium]
MRTKSRLTITLPPDLVQRLDRMIDHQTVRNRSHAIELLIRQGLMPEVTTAIVLAGGEHQGIGNPALAPVGGQALILLTLRHLVGFGIRNVLLLAGRSEPEIREVLGSGQGLGLTIQYLEEERPLGTAGALKSAEPHLPDSPVLVVHGDVLTDIDIGELITFHLSEGCLATMAVKPRNAEKECGQVMLQGNRITDFYDNGKEQGISIVNTGLYVLQPEVFGMIEEGKESRLETDVFPTLARMGELSAFFFQGIWYDIRNEENYQRAKARWQQKGVFRHAREA